MYWVQGDVMVDNNIGDFDYKGVIPEPFRTIREKAYNRDTTDAAKDFVQSTEVLEVQAINDEFMRSLCDTLNIMHWYDEKLKNIKPRVKVDYEKSPEMQTAMYCPHCNPIGASYDYIELDHLDAGIMVNKIIANNINSLDALSKLKKTSGANPKVADVLNEEAEKKKVFTASFARKLFWNSVQIKIKSLILTWIKSFGWLVKKWKALRKWEEKLYEQIAALKNTGIYYDIAGTMAPPIVFDMPMSGADMMKFYDKPQRIFTLDYLLYKASGEGWPFRNKAKEVDEMKLPEGMTKDEVAQYKRAQCAQHISEKESYFYKFASTEVKLLLLGKRMSTEQGKGLTLLFDVYKADAYQDPRVNEHKDEILKYYGVTEEDLLKTTLNTAEPNKEINIAEGWRLIGIEKHAELNKDDISETTTNSISRQAMWPWASLVTGLFNTKDAPEATGNTVDVVTAKYGPGVGLFNMGTKPDGPFNILNIANSNPVLKYFAMIRGSGSINPDGTQSFTARNDYFRRRLKNISLTSYRDWIDKSYKAIGDWVMDVETLCCIIRNIGFLGSNENWRPFLAGIIGILDYLMKKHELKATIDWGAFDNILLNAYKQLISFYLSQCYNLWSGNLKNIYKRIWEKWEHVFHELKTEEGRRCIPLDELLEIFMNGVDNLFDDLMALLKEFLTGYELANKEATYLQAQLFEWRKLEWFRDFLQKILDALHTYEICYKGSWAEQKHTEEGWDLKSVLGVDDPDPGDPENIERVVWRPHPQGPQQKRSFVEPTNDEIMAFLKNKLGYKYVDKSMFNEVNCSLSANTASFENFLDDLLKEVKDKNFNL
jgi:hypothetical protein